jgi:hypothetical protein
MYVNDEIRHGKWKKYKKPSRKRRTTSGIKLIMGEEDRDLTLWIYNNLLEGLNLYEVCKADGDTFILVFGSIQLNDEENTPDEDEMPFYDDDQQQFNYFEDLRLMSETEFKQEDLEELNQMLSDLKQWCSGTVDGFDYQKTQPHLSLTPRIANILWIGDDTSIGHKELLEAIIADYTKEELGRLYSLNGSKDSLKSEIPLNGWIFRFHPLCCQDYMEIQRKTRELGEYHAAFMFVSLKEKMQKVEKVLDLLCPDNVFILAYYEGDPSYVEVNTT